MKKLVKVLEFVVKVAAAVICMDIAVNLYDAIVLGSYWEWNSFRNLSIGYPLILGAAWLGFHVDNGVDFVMNMLNRKERPNLIVGKGGNIEGH